MSDALTSLMKVDLLRVPADVIAGLKSGLMTLSESNGVVYWAKNSGKTGIVQHLHLIPLDPSDFVSAEQLLQLGQTVKGAKAATLMATAASTVIIVAVVAVATIYLGRKIEKVGNAVAKVQGTLEQQDLREYLTKVTKYTAVVQAAAELLHGLQSEVADLVYTRIDRLAESRIEVLGFVGRLQQLISSPKTTEAQYAAAIDFIIQVLDLVPIALSVERGLCLLAGKPGVAQAVRERVGKAFFSEKARFQAWSEEQFRQLALGHGFVDALASRRADLLAFMNSQVHELLINGISPAIMERAVTEAVAASAQESMQQRTG